MGRPLFYFAEASQLHSPSSRKGRGSFFVGSGILLLLASFAHADIAGPPAGSYIRNQSGRQPNAVLNIASGTIANIHTSTITLPDGTIITSTSTLGGGGGGGYSMQPTTATVDLSSGVLLSGAAGNVGDVMTSGGVDTTPSWMTPMGDNLGNHVATSSITADYGIFSTAHVQRSPTHYDVIVSSAYSSGAANYSHAGHFYCAGNGAGAARCVALKAESAYNNATGYAYAIQAVADNIGKNRALDVSASGGAENYALYVNAGNVNLQPLDASSNICTDSEKNLTTTGCVSGSGGYAMEPATVTPRMPLGVALSTASIGSVDGSYDYRLDVLGDVGGDTGGTGMLWNFYTAPAPTATKFMTLRASNQDVEGTTQFYGFGFEDQNYKRAVTIDPLEASRSVNLHSTTTLKLWDGPSTHYVAFVASNTVASDVTWTLPNTDSDGCFQSDGSGMISIGECGTGGGGSSSMETMVNGVRISSPTPSQNFKSGTGISVTGLLNGDTAQITINSTIIGLSTKSFNTSGGMEAGDAITTGDNNTNFGYVAGTEITSGDGNSNFGSLAGDHVTIGDNNSLYGYGTGEYITSGFHNSCFGEGVCNDVTYGRSNACFGAGSALGRQTCQGITSGSSNTIVGASGGGALNGNETDSGNTFLGFNAGSAGVNNSICIGYNCAVTSSYTAVIGGSGADAVHVIMSSVTASTATFTVGTFVNSLRLPFLGTEMSVCTDSSGKLATSGCPTPGGDNMGTHIATKTVTMGYGYSGTTAVLTANNWAYDGYDHVLNDNSLTSNTNNSTKNLIAVKGLATRTQYSSPLYGGYFKALNTTNPGGENWGVYGEALSGAGAYNYGGYFKASGGDVNYGIYVEAGNVNIQGLGASLGVCTDGSKNLKTTACSFYPANFDDIDVDTTTIASNLATEIDARVQVGVATGTLKTSLDALNPVTMGVTFDGGGSALTASTSCVYVPYAATVTGWTVLADVVGSISVNVKKIAYASYPPSASICGTECPNTSGDDVGQDLSLSTWTTAISAGDAVCFDIDSASTITRANVIVRMTRP